MGKRMNVDLSSRPDGGYVVELDGTDVADHVNHVDLAMSPAGHVNVTLSLGKVKALFHGRAAVVVDQETAAVLRSLGWASPDQLDGLARGQERLPWS